jgi:hypothetical protein
MASWRNGSGLRILGIDVGAGLRPAPTRVRDLDFEYRPIVVRADKGNKGRVIVFPEGLRDLLMRQFERVRVLHDDDLHDGFGWVWPLFALARKRMSHAVFFASHGQIDQPNWSVGVDSQTRGDHVTD